MDANGLRSAFTRYFVERDHVALPAAGLIPHDQSVMFTIAGMVQFKPYFTGEETPPIPRATTIQPCFRMVDIELVGTTARHTTFFEMLGNFSFGDYFKELAIPYAWEFVTEVLGIDPGLLWVTVHESDNDAAGIWQDSAGIPPQRIQQMGEDNFWKMGDVGPCGPCSEIYFDRGPDFGADGGPAHGGEERFVEIWNLVFMQYERSLDGTLHELPKKNIDTGAGLERILAVLQKANSVFETSHIAPVVDEAARLCRTSVGKSQQSDVALRILADHSRAMTFLVSDGVFPSNEGRGYVLRRVIRRAVLRAQQLGVTDLVLPELIGSVIAQTKDAYPKLERDASLIATIVGHEEEAFRRTLRAGETLIEAELNEGARVLSGATAFRLHDTFGFPIDLTTEIATQRGVEVDRDGFDREMDAQRQRARRAERDLSVADATGRDEWSALIEQFGPSRFLGYEQTSATARVLSLRERDDGEEFRNYEGTGVPKGSILYEVVLDATPFYAEGGGQVGDTGTIVADGRTFVVLDTKYLREKLTGHLGYFLDAKIEAGEEVTASIDVARRNSIRRNHTATHLLHHALRTTLGDHVRQHGSLVAPERLRFDFSHFAPLSEHQLDKVVELVNKEVLTDHPVRTYETSRTDAEEAGAMAIFGEKYGDTVRVVESGSDSVELCGGTHVSALGMIGLFRVLSESSIGSNLRRIEATTGEQSLADITSISKLVDRTAQVLHVAPTAVLDATERTLVHQRELEDELRSLKAGQLRDEATTLAVQAQDGKLVARRDGLDPNALRELALSLRNASSIDVVALIGAADEDRVALVVASSKESGLDARAIASEAAKSVGGGGGGSPQLATAGGRDVAAIDTALGQLRSLIGVA